MASMRALALLAAGAATLLLAVVPSASAACDFCALDTGMNHPWAKPFDEDKEYPACKQYKDNACCTFETVSMIAEFDNPYGPEYAYDKCSPVGKPLSEKCHAWFYAEECAYNCDPNFGKYRHHDNCDHEEPWKIMHAPLKASVCTAWYEDCKDDTIPSCGGKGPACNADEGLYAGSVLSMGSLNATEETCSRTFGEIFGDLANPAQAFCNQVFDGAFVYEEIEADGLTFEFPVGSANPNDAVNAHMEIKDDCAADERPDDSECQGASRPKTVVPSGCQECKIRNVHWDGTSTKNVATPETVEDLGVCSRYSNNSCCGPDVAAEIPHGLLYGEGYVWDRCDAVLNMTMSEKCRNWFRAESCLYECDVNAGKYRKYPKCIDDNGDANMWQIGSMPLKASECDAWYEDCKDDYFCTCLEGECSDGVFPRSYFSMPALECSEDTCHTIGEIYANGTELCEIMYDGSFKYQEIEEDAYSMMWDPKDSGGINPNDLVNPSLSFPQTCPGIGTSKVKCPLKVEPKVPLHLVDDVINGDVDDDAANIIKDAIDDASDKTEVAIEASG